MDDLLIDRPFELSNFTENNLYSVWSCTYEVQIYTVP
jgi:hypothetical protein